MNYILNFDQKMSSQRELGILLKQGKEQLSRLMEMCVQLEKELRKKTVLLKKLRQEVPQMEKKIENLTVNIGKLQGSIEKTEAAMKDRKKEDEKSKLVEESHQYLLKLIRGELTREEDGLPADYEEHTEKDLDEMMDDELIGTAKCAHFYHVLFPEFLTDYPFDDKYIISHDPDCLGREEWDPEYESCCHKRFATYVVEPENNSSLTIHSKRKDLIRSGRIA